FGPTNIFSCCNLARELQKASFPSNSSLGTDFQVHPTRLLSFAGNS
ncbi:hypothetical protein LINPERHAP1_LOCUS10532, partial [Linum perenne]